MLDTCFSLGSFVSTSWIRSSEYLSRHFMTRISGCWTPYVAVIYHTTTQRCRCGVYTQRATNSRARADMMADLSIAYLGPRLQLRIAITSSFGTRLARPRENHQR